MPDPVPSKAPNRPSASGRAPRLTPQVGAVLVALMLGLLCTFVMTGAAISTQQMPGMAGMVGMAASGADQSDASSLPASLSACDGMCASDTETCTAAAAVGVPLLLALLVGTIRDTFLRLLPRSGTLRRRRRPDHWHPSGPTYAQLCVLRV